MAVHLNNNPLPRRKETPAGKLKTIVTDMAIRTKLLAIYILVIIIPILVFSLYLVYNMDDAFRASTLRTYQSTADQLAQNLINKLKSATDVLNAFAYDSNLIRYMRSVGTSDQDIYDSYQNNVASMIRMLKFRDPSMVVRIYTDSKQLDISEIFFSDPAEAGAAGNVDEILKSKNRLNWKGIIPYEGGKYVSCSAVIRDYESKSKSLGVLFLYYREEGLYSLIETYNKKAEGQIFITDEAGQIITSTVRGAAGSMLADAVPDRARFGENATGATLRYAGGSYIAVEQAVEDKDLCISGWKVLFLAPMSDISAAKASIWFRAAVLSLICLVISTLLVALFSRGFTKRIDALIRKMNKVKLGDTAVAVEEAGRDEIGQLTESFGTMVRELNRLMTEVYEANIRIKDTELNNQRIATEKMQAELLALQSQINPHYLFNTLESIRMKMLLKGDVETSEIVHLFGSSFRNLIYDREEKIRIRDELRNIMNFIRIQRFRFGDMVTCKIDVDKSLVDFYLPKLLIQPLVENAVYHGLEMKGERGTIWIGIARADGFITIRVRDDGVGMDEDTLLKLKTAIQSDGGAGAGNFALRNIKARLKCLYGNRYRFHIESEKGLGTAVTVAVPEDGENVPSADR